ncbi:MAG: hypothetical protein Q9162_005606 [Coniocarpon cinnabarinum]
MDPWSWLGFAKTTFHAADTTVDIPFKTSDSQSLKKVCSDPSVTPPCRLTPLLPGGHLQTVNFALSKDDFPIYYRRQVFDSDDPNYPGTFAVDFVSHADASEASKGQNDDVKVQRRPAQIKGNLFCPSGARLFEEDEWAAMDRGSQDTAPMLVVMHGLSGGSHEVYLKECLAPFVLQPKGSAPKWEACVVNARGCAGSAITSGVLFNARATWDFRQTVKWLRKRFPNRPLFGIGFSLGANILVNYLGEEGERCELDAAVSVSNPWDLNVSNLSLQRSWLGNEVYQRAMCSNLKKVLMRHGDELRKNPNIDLERILNTKYLYEFDRELQCPTWGYPTEAAYYRDAASVEPLMNVRTPLLCINAEDDPMSPPQAQPTREVFKNPYAVLCRTSMGGHLGWFEIGGTRWFPKSVHNFLRKMAEEADLQALKQGRKAQSKELGSRTQVSSFDPLRRKMVYQSEW